MVRTGRTCDGVIYQIPGAREKGTECPYRDLTQVPLAEKAKACRRNCVKGTRQISPVTLEEGVPAWRSGRSQ
jgi:hypothetical protein